MDSFYPLFSSQNIPSTIPYFRDPPSLLFPTPEIPSKKTDIFSVMGALFYEFPPQNFLSV